MIVNHQIQHLLVTEIAGPVERPEQRFFPFLVQFVTIETQEDFHISFLFFISFSLVVSRIHRLVLHIRYQHLIIFSNKRLFSDSHNIRDNLSFM